MGLINIKKNLNFTINLYLNYKIFSIKWLKLTHKNIFVVKNNIVFMLFEIKIERF